MNGQAVETPAPKLKVAPAKEPAAKKAPVKKSTPTKKPAIKKAPIKNGEIKRPIPKAGTKASPTTSKAASKVPQAAGAPILSPYPRHSIEKSLRIPKSILDQNAGKDCSETDAAKFNGLSSANGQFRSEVSSATKYGLLERSGPGRITVTELAKKILRPQSPEDEISGLRDGILKAPVISDVYKHYRGENIPDRQFFDNTLTDTFKIPPHNVSEFINVFIESLTSAKLVERTGDKQRIIDISSDRTARNFDVASDLKKLSKAASVSATDSCFIMMPFAAPLGDYYSKIYEPAIIKAGLTPVRADNDIFGTGKIIDQIWSGITTAKVLIAELTTRNPNVFYELGLAHALKKPVVLVSSNEDDVPFDLKHIRVIYYDKNDPFWGTKLIDKVAENILSAIAHPEEAILFKL